MTQTNVSIDAFNKYRTILHLLHLFIDIPMFTALPAKSNSDVMFCLQRYQGFLMKDHLCINPIRRIGLIHKWNIDSHKLKWSVQVNFFT